MTWERCFGHATDRAANATSKTTVADVRPLDNIRKKQVASIEKMDCEICTVVFWESIQGDSEIKNGKFGSAIWHSSSDKGLAG